MSRSRPKTYTEWKQAAQSRDERSGALAWRKRDETSLYDYRVIRRRFDELREIRASGDPHRLLFYLHEGIHGNMAGMGSASLYGRRSKFGTKFLISDYIDELTGALRQLAQADEKDISLNEKRDFFRRASDCFGRSALMLSGAGSLGPFHLGVVKAMAEENILPNIISGASAGSMVTAFAGCHKEPHMLELLDNNFTEVFSKERVVQQKNNKLMFSSDDVMEIISALIPDMTFEEAFEETGRYINVSVGPASLNQRSRLLNAVTSPNACIREAVLASCAIPGVFPPVTLAAKDRQGNRKPYIASRKWVDGSVTDDLPARRLMRLYGVNHFISSQTNPLVLWALQDPASTNLFAQMTTMAHSTVRDWSRRVYPFAMEAVRGVYPLNIATRMWFGLLGQDYTADVTILPNQRFFNPLKLLSPLSQAEIDGLVADGERSTWPKIEMIRNCTSISSCIDEALLEIEGRIYPTAQSA